MDTRVPTIPTNDRFRQEICDWLAANGLNANITPPDARPSIVDGKLTIEQQVLIDGRKQFDVASDTVKTHTVTVDVVVPPTPAVEYWLAEPCPACGR